MGLILEDADISF